ncbi:MAG: DUF4178 domain-containing protein [Planctomycetales bacterium]|nr:DUF4178 domain-containing protein [Planctomycetales bacterium]
MSLLLSRCPACGAPVTFSIETSLVAVCESCRSLVGRGDGALENYGKVADLVETSSPLELGLTSKFRGVSFEIVGRTQYRHAMGGVWDEWHVAFANGKWGWLAEAQGRFYLTFEREVPEGETLPAFDSLVLGERIKTVSKVPPLAVGEFGEATSMSAQGEIPFAFRPGERRKYADLSGSLGEFGTIDFSDDPPTLYLGNEVTLAQLGLVGKKRTVEAEGKAVAGVQINCPNCAGTLNLHAPDQALRVVCPHCNSLLDCTRGNLKYLEVLAQAKVKPIIPLGTVGRLFPDGPEYTVIGFQRRRVTVEGINYFWDEYLLYDRTATGGFRWLTHGDNHWNFVEPVSPGDVTTGDREAVFQGETFKLFANNTATTTYVRGEFYWQLQADEEASFGDYIRPPRMLSREIYHSKNQTYQELKEAIQQSASSAEVQWSLGTYLTRSQVEQGFGVQDLPTPSIVGMNQPFLHKSVYKTWLLLLMASCVLFGLNVILSRPKEVFNKTYALSPLQPGESSRVIFEPQPVDLAGGKNAAISLRTSLSNSWLSVDGDFFNEASGLVQPFSALAESYSGSDSDGPWSEGNLQPEAYVSPVPAGAYALRLEFSWEAWTGSGLPTVGAASMSPTVTVVIRQGVPRVGYFVLTLALLSVVPALICVWHFSFESRRWSESEYNPFPQASGGDDDDE